MSGTQSGTRRFSLKSAPTLYLYSDSSNTWRLETASDIVSIFCNSCEHLLSCDILRRVVSTIPNKSLKLITHNCGWEKFLDNSGASRKRTNETRNSHGLHLRTHSVSSRLHRVPHKQRRFRLDVIVPLTRRRQSKQYRGRKLLYDIGKISS